MDKLSEYAELEREMFRLRSIGDVAGEEGIMDQMDVIWYSMKEEELRKLREQLCDNKETRPY